MAAQPHASGHGRAAPVQSVRRPLPHLAAYGSTNKYRPVNSCKASGNTAKRPTLGVYFPCTTATMLTMTATVKAMDSQRWVCRTHLFHFNVTPLKTSPKRIGHTYKYYVTPFGESVLFAEPDEVRSTSIHDF